MPAVVIVNLGTGNLRSVRKALEHVGADEVLVSGNPSDIRNAGHLVLPGQGAIGTWMRQLEHNEELGAAVRERLAPEAGPVLGICLGLQALYDASEENGGTRCLGILEGAVRRFDADPRSAGAADATPRRKIPHMGWNQVRQESAHPLWRGIDDGRRFYFVHSYYAESDDADHVAGTCEYGNRFIAAAARDNLFATQFHPEKSQRDGLQLLTNFIHWNGVSQPCS